MIRRVPIYQILDITKLVKPSFYLKATLSNDKRELTAKKMKFKKAIKDFGYGIIIVRELNDSKYEVIDGWKRVEILKGLGETEIYCQNFGKISQKEAGLISRVKNHQWSNLSLIAFSKYLKSQFKKEELGNLTGILPEGKKELEDVYRLLDFDWSQFDVKELGGFDFWG